MTWAMGDDLETLSHALEAEVNLVVSSVGLRTAKYLEKEYGMPYVVGTPVGTFTKDIVKALATKERYPYKKVREEIAGKRQKSNIDSREVSKKNNYVRKVTLIGESVTTESLATAIEQNYPVTARVLCPLQETEDLLFRTSQQVLGEEDMEEVLKDADIIVADPLYRPICPKDCEFYELPHLAFSGRIYKKNLEKADDFWKYEKG